MRVCNAWTAVCFSPVNLTAAGAADVSPPNQDEGVSRSENTGLRKPLRNGQRNALAQVFRAVGAFGGRLPIGDPCTLTTNDERSTERENGWLTPQGFAVVTCNASGFVEGLDLSRMGLKGAIPDAIARFPALKFLSMSNNELSGPIPASLGLLRKLDSLLLHRNRLNGPLPDALFQNCPLRNLVLYGNLITGPIPSAIKYTVVK